MRYDAARACLKRQGKREKKVQEPACGALVSSAVGEVGEGPGTEQAGVNAAAPAATESAS